MKPDDLVEMEFDDRAAAHDALWPCRMPKVQIVTSGGERRSRTLLIWYWVAMKRLASDVRTFPAPIFQTGPIFEKT
ncbi:hypothetical protein [Rhizobium mongolense]|uniref:hypothetical protein n=1 Tax=Rhizobium mongolense TaxID=57676 RepID=UPI000B8A1558|nr:hypothetical protein [Rhizobium mongolense]